MTTLDQRIKTITKVNIQQALDLIATRSFNDVDIQLKVLILQAKLQEYNEHYEVAEYSGLAEDLAKIYLLKYLVVHTDINDATTDKFRSECIDLVRDLDRTIYNLILTAEEI